MRALLKCHAGTNLPAPAIESTKTQKGIFVVIGGFFVAPQHLKTKFKTDKFFGRFP